MERLYRLLHHSAHETRLFRFTGRQTFLMERTKPPPMVFTNHETRNTNHGFFLRFARPSRKPLDSAAARLNRAARKNRLRDDSVPARTSLHFSPRGEAKWVRGPSGRGASRLARAGVLAESPPSPFGSRNAALPVHWPSDISSGANQVPAHGFHESRDTKHESRPFPRVLRPSDGEKCRLDSINVLRCR